jgi:Tol biopolymer transport system component
VVFESEASNLVLGDFNGASDIFLADLQKGGLKLISQAKGIPGNHKSNRPNINVNGSVVAFNSEADNLVTGDDNVSTDVFVANPSTGVITLVSVNSAGKSAYGNNDSPSLNADGTKVAFRSYATDLGKAVNDGNAEIYVKDLSTGTLKLVSTSKSGTQANGMCWDPALSPDGKHVAFVSNADNLVDGDTNNVADVFVKDLASGAIVRIGDLPDINGDGEAPAFSGDGKTIAFTRWNTGSVTTPTNTENVYTVANPFADKPPTNVNKPPIANAGSAQTVTVGTSVTLNGTASSDPDNGPSPLTYQ